MTSLPPGLSESQFLKTLIDFAVLKRWMVSHPLPARTSKGWATATQGHVGAPDLLLARDGVVLHVELKSERGRLSPMQTQWAGELGANYRCWRPSDWATIQEELS